MRKSILAKIHEDQIWVEATVSECKSVVKYIREVAKQLPRAEKYQLNCIALEIERGEHRNK